MATAKKTAKKAAPAKAVAKKSSAKKAAPAKVVKKSAPAKPASKAAAKPVAKKAAAKKAAPSAKKAVAKKAVPAAKPTRSPNIVKPQLSHKRTPAKPFPAKLQQTTKGDSTTITVTPLEVKVAEVVVEEKRLLLPPPPAPNKSMKKGPTLKPIKAPPAPLLSEGEEPWTSAELKSMRADLAKDLIRLKEELVAAESEMDDLISSAGVGAGDDQADAGTKTFEREHEMSLVYNARDMVLQTERALDRIDSKTYGRCEECGNSIGKARLQVFPRATLCMACKQKEERR
jgi:RNA polymerase-binding transcription factor DksA